MSSSLGVGRTAAGAHVQLEASLQDKQAVEYHEDKDEDEDDALWYPHGARKKYGESRGRN